MKNIINFINESSSTNTILDEIFNSLSIIITTNANESECDDAFNRIAGIVEKIDEDELFDFIDALRDNKLVVDSFNKNFTPNVSEWVEENI